jgi:enoyl-CoA hydratase/carnithine racemase
VSGTYTTIEVRNDDATAWLRLHREDLGNAIDSAACGELCDALAAAGEDDAVRVVVLAAEGASFSVAGDLGSALPVGDPSPVPAADGVALLAAMRELPKPIVAVIQGECHSAGMAVVAACDLAIASSRARFWMPELKGGLWPALPLASLGRAIGRRKALELALLGAPIDARAAVALGLVQRLVEPDQLEIEAFVMVRALAQRSPTALRHGLPAFRAGLDEDLGSALTRARGALDAVLASEDAREAIAAYAAQRPPVWKNR